MAAAKTSVDQTTTNTGSASTVTGGSQVTNTSANANQTVLPYQSIVPGLDQFAQSALTALQNPVATYNGRYAAEPTLTQHQGEQSLINAAPGLSIGSDQLRTLGLDTVAGKYLSPDSNPYIKAAYAAAVDPITQQLQRSILPGIGDKAQMSGAYGGSRQGIQEGVAAGDWAKASGDIGAQMYAQNYANERQLQMQAPSLFTAANSLALAPGQVLSAVGQQQQDWENQLYAGGIQSAKDHAAAQWAPIQNYADVLKAFSPYVSSVSNQTGVTGVDQSQTSHTDQTQTGTNVGTTTTTPASGGLGGIFSGALGGASAGAAFGPWGAGIGGILGALGGL